MGHCQKVKRLFNTCRDATGVVKICVVTITLNLYRNLRTTQRSLQNTHSAPPNFAKVFPIPRKNSGGASSAPPIGREGRNAPTNGDSLFRGGGGAKGGGRRGDINASHVKRLPPLPFSSLMALFPFPLSFVQKILLF